MKVPKPSPAMAVASIALFVSMGGVSYGVATGTIDSREIKNNNVRSVDVRNNTLTGADISEAKLGQVPSAAAATRATTAANATTADRAKAADTATTAGSAAPSGPAGGSLAGTYPNPTIGEGKVDSGTVLDDSLTGADIAEATLGTVPDATRLAGRLPADFLASTVYRRESAVDAGTALGDGTFVQAQSCDPGDVLLSGGPANVNPTSIMVESFPSPGQLRSWSARINKAGAADNFNVVVHCIDQP